MNLRVSAEQAGWTIREAAWDLEERVLWRGSDASREAVGRAARAVEPLQRLIQTRLTWPISDVLRRRSAWTRAAIAASAVSVALGAAAGGAITASHHPAPAPAGAPAPSPLVVRTPAAGEPVALQGVVPHFQPGHAAPAPPPPQPPARSAAPPEQVAWQFSQAFVAYEVGRSSKKTKATFTETTTKPLAKALGSDPPRLPSKGKVPQARVLNVVLANATKRQVTASVSLVRLRAISELRLTLTKTGDAWRVAQVLG